MQRIFLYLVIGLFLTSTLLVKASVLEEPTLKGTASYSNIIPKHTKLKVSINDEIDGLRSQVGDEFNATVLTDLNVNDVNLIPVGSLVVGHITDIMHAGKASMQGTIEVSFDKIMLPSGEYIPLEGARFATDSTYTDKKHNLKGEANGLARNIGINAVKGATLTFIPGNKAVKSVAVGAAATGAVFSGGWSVGSTATIGAVTGLYTGLRRHGEEVMIASGQELEIELSQEQDLNPIELAVDDVMNQGIEVVESNETLIE